LTPIFIFGHSGHIFRGIEIYKSKPIIYCAGDFIDDYAVDEVERNDESFIFVLEIDTKKKMKKITIYPTLIKHFQADLACGEHAKVILSKMKNLCLSLDTTLEVTEHYGVIIIGAGNRGRFCITA